MKKLHFYISKLFPYVLCVCIIFLAVALCKDLRVGKNIDVGGNSEQNLLIYATVDRSQGMKTIANGSNKTNEEYGTNKVTLLGVGNVTIGIGDNVIPLEEAISMEYISTEIMIAYARMDAKEGFCEEISESNNGLTRFIYRYPEVDLVYIYDIYETPNQKQYLISELAICAPGRSPSFLYIDEETGEPIDYEDWGICFEVLEINQAGLMIKCTQNGGQQIGKLIVEYYELYRINTEDGQEEYVDRLTDDFFGESNINCIVDMGGTTDIFIDFLQQYGEIPSGDYYVYLTVKDEYSENDVLPLMKNYYDEQRFRIQIRIE